jgi:hypothetical protein
MMLIRKILTLCCEDYEKHIIRSEGKLQTLLILKIRVHIRSKE